MRYEVGQLMQFVGESMGRKCSFPVRISGHHPSIDGVYTVSALFADNCLFEPGWVNARDLRMICEDPACGATLTEDLQCPKCGVSHTHPGCPECGRHGHHKDGCSLIGEYVG